MGFQEKKIYNNTTLFFFNAGTILIAFCVVVIGVTAVTGKGFCAEAGSGLDFELPVPDSASHRQYLGLKDTDRFSFAQIKADIVIIEIFSMYCPICQKEAENINALYHLIQSDPAVKKRIKLIGIGAGNSAFEVNFFRQKYDIPFPLFSDSDFSIHKKIGQVRTPHFFGLKIIDKHAFTVFFSQSDSVEDPGAFLQKLLKASKAE